MVDEKKLLAKQTLFKGDLSSIKNDFSVDQVVVMSYTFSNILSVFFESNIDCQQEQKSLKMETVQKNDISLRLFYLQHST